MFHHVVAFLFLSFWGALSSIASSSCASDIGGCQDDMALLQVGVNAHAVGQEGRTAHALLLELGGNLGTAEGQGALLKYGENLVRMMNATKHLDESQETLLSDIIELINTQLITNIDAEHEDNQNQLNTSAADIEQCNTVLATSNATGNLSIHRAATEETRGLHLTCRAKELVLYTAKSVATTNLYTHIQAINPAVLVPFNEQWKVDKSVDLIADYFAQAQGYVTWFNQAKSVFEEKRNASAGANTTHSAKKGLCVTAQNSFETQYGLFMQAFEFSCSTHETCYNTQFADYGTLLDRLKVVEGHHHDAYEAAIIIISKIQCLLATGDNANCEQATDTLVHGGRYLLTVPVVASKSSCDTAEVHDPVCSATFKTNEYDALDNFTPPEPRECVV